MSIGYDKLNLNHQLLLGLTFEEMTGTITHDRAKPAHPCTLNGVPTWNSLGNGLPYLDFNSATPDWLSCPQADTTDLEFDNVGDCFSMAVWVNPDSLHVGGTMLLVKGLLNTDGWFFYSIVSGEIYLTTNQGAAQQTSESPAGVLNVDTWTLVGATRAGATVNLYVNGIERTIVYDTHIDPATANRELHIGVDDAHAAGFDGKMWYPRIWGRQLAEWEMLELFNIERRWLGV